LTNQLIVSSIIM